MTLRVLVVCTANVCRSPMGEALLAHRLTERGVASRVTSAGTQAGALSVDPAAVTALAERGLDISAHRPRPLSRDIVRDDGADLVITMTRAHLRYVAISERSAFRRTFTLPELVRRARVLPGTRGLDLQGWIDAVREGRRASDLLGDDPRDDVADPYGTGLAAVRRTAHDIDQLVRELSMLAPWTTKGVTT